MTRSYELGDFRRPHEGDGKGFLHPKNPARRSEMVAIMARYIDYLMANYSGTISLKPLGDVEPDAADADAVDDPQRRPRMIARLKHRQRRLTALWSPQRLPMCRKPLRRNPRKNLLPMTLL